MLTGEKKRQKVKETRELKVPEVTVNYNSPVSSAQKKKEPTTQVKQGVGYTTGVGSAWNVQEYLESKEAKNDQIATIVCILMHSIKDTSDGAEEAAQVKDSDEQGSQVKIEMKDLILESALLPILEQAMRSGSLLEMAKETLLYNAYLDLIVELAQNENYFNLLDNIGSDYVPEQKVSIQTLLENVAGQSQIFLSCLTDKDTSGESAEDKKSRLLAERIIKTEEVVKKKMKETLRKEHTLKLQSLASLPLDKAYQELLAPLRFDYMNMKKNQSDKNYSHAYDDQA